MNSAPSQHSQQNHGQRNPGLLSKPKSLGYSKGCAHTSPTKIGDERYKTWTPTPTSSDVLTRSGANHFTARGKARRISTDIREKAHRFLSEMVETSRILRPLATSHSRTRPEEIEPEPSEIRRKSVPGPPPPAYAEQPLQDRPSSPRLSDKCHSPAPTLSHTNPDPYHILTAIVEEQDLQERGKCNTLFYWGLVQIMADTFSADFERLRAAMANDPEKKMIICSAYRDGSFVLSELGQAGLEQLCALVRKLVAALRRNRWPMIYRWEKILLIQLVIQPARRMKVPADYVLEVLGRYMRGNETGTMVDYWTPSCRGLRPKCSSPMIDLGDTLASHALLTDKLPVKDEVLEVLEAALVTFQKDRGMDRLQNSKELQSEALLWKMNQEEGEEPPLICLWPVSDDYSTLAKVLRESKNMKDILADAQRERLRKARNSRSYFQIV